MSASPTERRTVRVHIEGRVQGVGFRYFVERAATELGLAGFVRNRRDGAVEALLSGPCAAVEEMLERCRRGPSSARVRALTIIAEGEDEPTGFVVLPSI
jgi:acylphosphatase